MAVTVAKTQSESVASYPDFLFVGEDDNRLQTKLYDKEDSFSLQISAFDFGLKIYQLSMVQC